MRDILITVAGVLLSVMLLVSLMLPQAEQRPVSRPNTEDAGDHGLKALHAWLTTNKVNTLSLRRPATRIDQEALPESGNLMITSLPHSRGSLDSEWAALHDWVSRGNTILVLASLYHLPQWSDGFDRAREDKISDAIARLTAGEFTLQRDPIEVEDAGFSLDAVQASIEAFKSSTCQLKPFFDHALFDQVEVLESLHMPGLYQTGDELGQVQASYWTIDSDAARLALRIVVGESTDQTAVWLLPTGSGWVYISAFPDLVSNAVLKQRDNARWLSNLIAHSVSSGGYVVFDDYHFGLSDLYDPEAFFADERLHNSLLFIGAFWLVYALGRSPRLAPVARRSAKPASRDFIEAMAGFFTRRIKARTVARELAGCLLDNVAQRTQLEGDSLWHWLHDHPGIAEQDVNRLRRASESRQGRINLIQLTRSIHRIEKVLS